MSNIQTEIDPKLGIYEDAEPPGKPLHEYVAGLFTLTALLWEYRRTIFVRVLVAMAVSFGILLLVPNKYTATTVLTPPDSTPMSGMSMLISAKTGVAQLAASQMGDMLGMRSPGQLYIQQLMSRPVQDRIIERFNLHQVYGTKTRFETRKALTAATAAEENKKTGAVEVSVTDRSAARAAQMANAYAEELGMLLSRINAESAGREREYFEKQLLSAKAQLDSDSKQLAEFGSKSGIIDVSGESAALISGAAAIEGQLLAAESELKGMLQIYAPQHERVQSLQARIAELRRQLQQIRGKVPASAGKDAMPDTSVKGLWSASTPYMDIFRKVKIQESIVETLAQQYELSKLQELHNVDNVQVFDPADVPERKSAPHRATITALIGILVFLSQAGFLLARHSWRAMPADDPWRSTLEPVVSSASKTLNRWKSYIDPPGRHLFARFRRRNHEARAETD